MPFHSFPLPIQIFLKTVGNMSGSSRKRIGVNELLNGSVVLDLNKPRGGGGAGAGVYADDSVWDDGSAFDVPLTTGPSRRHR